MNTKSAHYLRPLILSALAIFAVYALYSGVRMAGSHRPSDIYGIKSLWPSDQIIDDSWMAMRQGYWYITTPHDKPIYSTLFIEKQVKFQYPLSSLFVMYATTDSTVLNSISLASIPVTCLFMVLIFNTFLTTASGKSFKEATGGEKAIRIALPVIMTLSFQPLMFAYRLGQIQPWLTMGFVIATWLFMRGALTPSGAMLGLLTLVKPQFAIFLIWGALRKKWSFCASFFAVALVGTLLSLAVFGLKDNLDYLNVLKLLSQRGEQYVANQSVNGLVTRFLHGSVNDWKGYFLPPFSPVVYAATLISTLLFIGGAMFVPARFRGGIADFMLAGFTSAIASPVAWTHHYGVLLPVFAALFAWTTRERPLGRWTLPLTCASFFLIGLDLGWFWGLGPTKLNFIQAYPFFGVLIALGILYVWVLRGEPGGEESISIVKEDAVSHTPVVQGSLA